jgi:hypothetical protein
VNGANGGTHGGPNGSPNGGRHAPHGGNGGGRPLTVQGDKTILAEVQAEGFAEARDYLALFAELKKCPEYVHTYEITPLSIWNAAAAGLTADAIISFLVGHSRYPVPPASTATSARTSGASACSACAGWTACSC